MRATIKTGSYRDARPQDKKEMTKALSLVAVRNGKAEELVTVRCWMGKSNQASTVYASVWIHNSGPDYHNGHGTAGGYGYCKHSAAIQEAFVSAGVEFDVHVRGGSGMSVVEECMMAIGRALGYRGHLLIVRH